MGACRFVGFALALNAAFATAFVPLYDKPTFICGRSVTSIGMGGESASVVETVSLEPKEAVKLFGRLAEKYIMLDASGGMCCYSACSDCEYRNPDGGYIMADQSASRPKWIPVYDHRAFESSGKQHTSKWSSDIFKNGPAVTKEEFISALVGMTFSTPLGGPYVSASAGKIEDTNAAELLFDVLAGEKEKLTKHRMGKVMRELANGEEGLTWPSFSKSLGVA